MKPFSDFRGGGRLAFVEDVGGDGDSAEGSEELLLLTLRGTWGGMGGGGIIRGCGGWNGSIWYY